MIEITGLHVEVVRLQVAVLRRHRVQAVVRQYDRLRVLQFHEYARTKHVIGFERVTLAGRDRVLVRSGAARQQRNVRALASLAKRVACLQSVSAAAEIGGKFGREFVAGGEKNLRAEALEQRPPRFVAW